MQRLSIGVFAAVLFLALSIGSAAAVCGDGIIDIGEGPGEMCDLGANNGQTGVCCSATCQCEVGSSSGGVRRDGHM